VLTVNVRVDKSPIHGYGIFATEDIPADTEVWRFDGSVDRLMSPHDVLRDGVISYVFWDDGAGSYVLPGDDAVYTNHSDEPNMGPSGGRWVALRDVRAGEELTEDYANLVGGPLRDPFFQGEA
jgi:SET domain-containing protein